MTIDLKQIADSLNDFTFQCEILSTKEKIMGRPYTIKDEFKLAQIQTQESNNAIVKVILDIVKEKYYTLTAKQIESLTMVDLQWLMINLKINSKENNIETVINCKCGESFDYTLPLSEIKLKDGGVFEKAITITEKRLKKPLTLLLRMPTISMITNNYDTENTKSKENDKIIFDVIKSISYGDETSDASDFSKDELIDFVNDIPKKYLDDINDFLGNPPELVYSKNVVCGKCKEKTIITVDDFFMLLF